MNNYFSIKYEKKNAMEKCFSPLLFQFCFPIGMNVFILMFIFLIVFVISSLKLSLPQKNIKKNRFIDCKHIKLLHSRLHLMESVFISIVCVYRSCVAHRCSVGHVIASRGKKEVGGRRENSKREKYVPLYSPDNVLDNVLHWATPAVFGRAM